MAARWYLGPLGDIRELVSPEPNIEDSSVRYGGVHQGLSGARTIDVTGHRSQFTFEFRALTQEDFAWIRALHMRHVPGPLYLLDPRYKNRLSPQSTAMHMIIGSPGQFIAARGLGVVSTNSARNWSYDWPAEAGPIGVRSQRFQSYPVTPPLDIWRFDFGYPIPVLPGETITYSLYVRCEDGETQPFYLLLDFFDRLGETATSERFEREATGDWSRVSYTFTVPDGVAAIGCGGIVGHEESPTSYPLLVAAPQVESGPEATEWEMGGGARRVHVDQLSSSSPKFPLTDCTLTLLEA